MLLEGAGAGRSFLELPPLSCGQISGAVVIAVDEVNSTLGQVLFIGGRGLNGTLTSATNSATGGSGPAYASTPQADPLLRARI
jgi:hypothetical protein